MGMVKKSAMRTMSRKLMWDRGGAASGTVFAVGNPGISADVEAIFEVRK